MKKCPKCKIEKSEDNFWKTCSYCKLCYNENKRSLRNTPERKKEISVKMKNYWIKKNGRQCKKCENIFVGKGRKRDYCSTMCKILDSVDKKKNGCWEWKGPLGTFGYASTTCYETNKREHAHRISYRLFKGEIPENLYVCHHCDNPKCIAPEHLFIGSAKENMQDAKNKGRLEHVKLLQSKGEKNGSSKLKEIDVLEIKQLINEKKTIYSIAKKFNVSWTTIDSIKKGRSWKYLNESLL